MKDRFINEIKKVAKDLSIVEITKAYRTLAKKYHPDCNGSHEDFLKLTAAYNYIIDSLIPKHFENSLLDEIFVKRGSDIVVYIPIDKSIVIDGIGVPDMEVDVIRDNHGEREDITLELSNLVVGRNVILNEGNNPHGRAGNLIVNIFTIDDKVWNLVFGDDDSE